MFLWFFFLFLQTEVIFLGQLRHPHLVKLIGYCCEDEHRLLVYEYMPRGSLENQLFRSMFNFLYTLIFAFLEAFKLFFILQILMCVFLLYRVFSVTAMVNENENCARSCKRPCLPPRSRKPGYIPWLQSFKHLVRLCKYINLYFNLVLKLNFVFLFVNTKCLYLYSFNFQDYTPKLSDFGLAKDGPEGDDTHVSTRVMGTQGYAAPEYIMTGTKSYQLIFKGLNQSTLD